MSFSRNSVPNELFSEFIGVISILKYFFIFSNCCSNDTVSPVLFISTEQTKDEIQTMMLAFLSNVNEDHILNGKYVGDELARVREAA